MEAEKLIENPNKKPVSFQSKQQNKAEFEMRSVVIPPNRMTPLKANWEKILETVTQNMKLQIRLNLKKKTVDVREC